METATRNTVERFNEVLARVGYPYRLDLVPVGQIRRLQKNARFMASEQFRNLVENVRRDGGLSSVPFCVRRDGVYTCLSGNHRLDAAQDAHGPNHLVLILYTDEKLERSREVAIQLSHNAIAGQDDPAILRSLWHEIEDVAEKYYAGLDDETLKELEKVGGSGLAPVRLDYRTVSFLFLPEESEALDKTLDDALKRSGGADTVHLAGMSQFHRLLETLEKAKKRHNVKNSAVALMLVLDAYERLIQTEENKNSGGVVERGGTPPGKPAAGRKDNAPGRRVKR